MSQQILELFFKWLVLHLAGILAMIYAYDRCFKRRNSLAAIMIYFVIRGVLRSYMSAMLATGNMSRALYTFDVVFVAITAVVNFIMLWYTWDADAIKIGIAGITADLLTGTAMVLSIGSANLLQNGAFEPDMVTLNTGYTVGASAALCIMVILMIRLLDPVTRWFRTVEFEHRRVIAIMIILCIALFSSTNLTDTAGFDVSSYLVCLIGVLLMVPVTAYIVKMLDIQRNRKVLLRQQTDMSSAYIIAVGSQSESIASHRQLLDSVSAQIESSDSKLVGNEMSRYIRDLKMRADRLRSGIYSSNIAVDAVLTAFAARIEAAGYTADLKTDSLEEDNTEAAEISWILMNWAESVIESAENTKAKQRAADSADKSTAARSVSFRIIRQGNQMIFMLKLTGAGKAAFPERLLRGHVSKSDVISSTYSGDTVEVKVMTAISGTAVTDAARKEAI